MCIRDSSGTDYEPPVPNKDKTVAELEAILTDADASTTDKALAAFTWGARGQFFWDGNKRTSLMLANKIDVYKRQTYIRKKCSA